MLKIKKKPNFKEASRTYLAISGQGDLEVSRGFLLYNPYVAYYVRICYTSSLESGKEDANAMYVSNPLLAEHIGSAQLLEQTFYTRCLDEFLTKIGV